MRGQVLRADVMGVAHDTRGHLWQQGGDRGVCVCCQAPIGWVQSLVFT